ncbi:MAG: lamin tail domain-containing protein [bacterium]
MGANMLRILITGTWAALAINVQAQIIFTEVMFNPRGNENANEFVELYNTSASDTILLAGWKIGDQDALDEIISPQSQLRLPPQRYALILDPNYFQAPAQYDSLIPGEAMILTAADNAFGSGGFSNSTAETIILVDANGDTVAKYLYSPGNPDGISDEKIDLTADDALQNWANAAWVDGTPGFTNSVAPRPIDGELIPASLRLSPSLLREDVPVTIAIAIRNAGVEVISELTVEFDLIPSGREFGMPVDLGNIRSASAMAGGDTLQLDFRVPNLRPGKFRLLARLSVAADAHAGNDTTSIQIAVGWRREVIVLNEVMFDPGSGQPEWIEIYNPQAFSVPLGDWLVADESGGKSTPALPREIPPRRYRVLTASAAVAQNFGLADTAVILLNRFPSLNNGGDAVLLHDFSGALIDSLAYEGDWGQPGKSIEKIWHERGNNQRNWLPSRASRGATPAAFNSVSPREYDLEIGPLRINPQRPHYGESIHLEAPVFNSGRRTLSSFSVVLHYEPDAPPSGAGPVWLAELPITLELHAQDSFLVEIPWAQPPSGKIKITAEVRAEQDCTAENSRTSTQLPVGYPSRSAVINEIYNAPLSGEIEWFEIFNPSAAPVNLAEWLWRDGDAVSPAILPDCTLVLAPGEFAVLSATGSIPHLIEGALHLPLTRWLTLNNDEERIEVFDFNRGRQDSLRFNSRWGGTTGVSLERINPHLTTQDSSNWSSCVDHSGSTPGRANSILTTALPAAATLSVSPNPFSPDEDGFHDFALLQINLPVTTAAVQVKIYDLRGRLIRHLLNNQPVGSQYQAIWNGRDDRGESVRTGLYIVYLQALRADEGILLEAKATIIVARALN